MIKDKITSDLKAKLLDEIRKAKLDGKRRGIFLCKDVEGKIVASKPCEGDQCTIAIEDPFVICPFGLKGNVHIEPYLSSTKREYQNKGLDIPSDDLLKEEIIRDLKNIHETKKLGDLPVVSPSYLDTLNSILLKCYKDIDTTTCIGSDLDSTIECWTPKKDLKKGQCIRALFDQKYMIRKKESFFPKKWIIPLFNKEIINLK